MAKPKKTPKKPIEEQRSYVDSSLVKRLLPRDLYLKLKRQARYLEQLDDVSRMQRLSQKLGHHLGKLELMNRKWDALLKRSQPKMMGMFQKKRQIQAFLDRLQGQKPEFDQKFAVPVPPADLNQPRLKGRVSLKNGLKDLKKPMKGSVSTSLRQSSATDPSPVQTHQSAPVTQAKQGVDLVNEGVSSVLQTQIRTDQRLGASQSDSVAKDHLWPGIKDEYIDISMSDSSPDLPIPNTPVSAPKPGPKRSIPQATAAKKPVKPSAAKIPPKKSFWGFLDQKGAAQKGSAIQKPGGVNVREGDDILPDELRVE